MESLTIEHLDPSLEDELRERAARHGLSVSEEARRILAGALAPPSVRPDRPALSEVEVRARVAEVLAHARRPDHPADWKALSDELWDFAE